MCKTYRLTDGSDDGGDKEKRPGEVPFGPGVVNEPRRRRIIVQSQQIVEVGSVDRWVRVEKLLHCGLVSLSLRYLVVAFEQ